MATDTAELLWITMEHPGLPRSPQWMRSAAVDETTNTVFVPAATAGNEQAVIYAALWDGSVLVTWRWGHTFVPSLWMVKEFPETAEVCASIERRVAKIRRG